MTTIRYRLRAGESLISVEDYRQAARRRLPKMVWAYIDGGADDLVALRDNRLAFDLWALRSRALTGHERRDLTTSVAGTPIDLPVVLAPTGFTGLSHWRGDVAAARGAERMGTRYILSTASSWSLEEVVEATNEDHFFQLYPRADKDRAAELMSRAWDQGYKVLFVTVDVPALGNREGERRLGMGVPPVLTPKRILNAARYPRWSYDFVRHGRIAAPGYLSYRRGIQGALESIGNQYRDLQATLNWMDISWMRELWPGRFYIKGLLDPRDAVRAIDVGADGIVVSNHGGRQLDYARAPLDVLPEVAAAAGDKLEILLDGGVRRGTDVIKALALGARAVMIGRPYLYGLATNGEEGVATILGIFRAEIERALTLMGVKSVHHLDPSWLVPRPAIGRSCGHHSDAADSSDVPALSELEGQ